MRLRSKGSSQSTSTFYNTSKSTPNPTSDSTKTPNDSDGEGEYDKVIPVLANYSLPSWKRYFTNCDGKRRESKSIVNISVTYGSPMALLFLPTVWKNSKKCYTNSTKLALKSGSA